MTNRQLVNMFLREKMLCSAPRTLEYYTENLKKFYNWYEQHAFVLEPDKDPVEIPFRDATKDMYLEYLTYLKSCGIKNTSLHTYHRAVRTFCNWLVKEGYLEKSWTSVKLPRADAEPIVPLTAREVERIDAALKDSWYAGRNYCIIHLMLDCGLRRQEVINLKPEDFVNEQDVSYLIIKKSKYNKNRMVPVPPVLVTEIQKCITYAPFKQKYLFNNFDNGDQLTIDTIKNLFRKLKLETGIDRLHPHLLRHTFATSFIAGGGSLEFLRMYLGHTDYAITQKYLHISFQQQICNANIYKLDKIFFKNYNNYEV